MAYDMEAMRRRSAQARSGGKFWKPPEGNTKVRILPGEVGNCDPNTFFRTIHTYNIKFPDGFKRLRSPKGKWNPIESCRQIFSEGGMAEEAKNLKARSSFAMNICVHGSEEIQVWNTSSKQLDKLLGFMEDEDWGDFTDPDEGFCITVNRTGEGLATRYDVTPSKTEGSLPDEWRANANDLREEEGEEIDPKTLVAMLNDKYEDKYEDLSSELLKARRRWVKAQNPDKPKTKRKVKKS